jgi:hypothetical protein
LQVIYLVCLKIFLYLHFIIEKNAECDRIHILILEKDEKFLCIFTIIIYINYTILYQLYNTIINYK